MLIKSTDVFYFRMSSELKRNPNESDSAFEKRKQTRITNYFNRGRRAGFADCQILYEQDSGGNDDRTVYNNIIRMILDGDVKRVFTPNISRFSRSLDGLDKAISVLTNLGAEIWSTGEDIIEFVQYQLDNQSDVTELRYRVEAAEKERKKYQGYAVNGHRAIRENGRALKDVFPYRREGDVLVPNTEPDAKTGFSPWYIAEDMVRHFLENKVLSSTADYLRKTYGDNGSNPQRLRHPVTPSGVRQLLESSTIRGHMQYKKGTKVVYNTHQRLITKNQGSRINKILKVNRQGFRPSTGLKNLWQGLAYCFNCGTSIRVATRSDREGYCFCRLGLPTNKAEKRRLNDRYPNRICNESSSFGLSPVMLEKYCIEAISFLSLQVKDYDYQPIEINEPPHILLLRSEILGLEETVATDPLYATVLEAKQKILADSLEQLRQRSESQIEAARKEIKDVSKKDFWKARTADEKARLFRSFIETIYVARGMVFIVIRKELANSAMFDRSVDYTANLSWYKEQDRESWFNELFPNGLDAVLPFDRDLAKHSSPGYATFVYLSSDEIQGQLGENHPSLFKVDT